VFLGKGAKKEKKEERRWGSTKKNNRMRRKEIWGKKSNAWSEIKKPGGGRDQPRRRGRKEDKKAKASTGWRNLAL